MDENKEREQEPEAERQQQVEEGNQGGPPEGEEELRDEGLDRSASGALRPLGDK